MDIKFKKVTDKMTMIPGTDDENSRILISYLPEEITPPPTEITISAIRENIRRIDENIKKLNDMRKETIQLLTDINNDENIPLKIDIQK